MCRHLIIIILLSYGNLAAEERGVLVAGRTAQGEVLVCLKVEDGAFMPVWGFMRLPDGSVDWSWINGAHEGQGGMHFDINLAPFSIKVQETNWGDSLRVARGEGMVSVERLGYGVHVDGDSYGAIIQVDGPLLPIREQLLQNEEMLQWITEIYEEHKR